VQRGLFIPKRLRVLVEVFRGGQTKNVYICNLFEAFCEGMRSGVGVLIATVLSSHLASFVNVHFIILIFILPHRSRLTKSGHKINLKLELESA
jgi:hypothetical protein